MAEWFATTLSLWLVVDIFIQLLPQRIRCPLGGEELSVEGSGVNYIYAERMGGGYFIYCPGCNHAWVKSRPHYKHPTWKIGGLLD